MKGKYVIIDLENMEYFKNENGEMAIYEKQEDASIACGFYELENVWVCELKYNHKESEIWPEQYE